MGHVSPRGGGSEGAPGVGCVIRSTVAVAGLRMTRVVVIDGVVDWTSVI